MKSNGEDIIHFKHIIFYGLLIVLFLNVFPHVNFIKDTVFYISLLIFLTLIYFKKIEFILDTPLTLPISLFVLWALLTSVFAQDPYHSFQSFYSHLIRYVLLYYVLLNIFKDKSCIIIVSWVIVVSSVIFFTWGLIYFYLILNNSIYIRFGFLSFSINIIGFTTIFSMLLSMQLLSMKIHFSQKLFLIFGVGILITAALMTQSRATFISLVLSSMIFFLKSKRLSIVFVGALVVLATMFPVKDRLLFDKILDDKPRMMLLYYSMAIVKENPLLGTGFAIDTFKNSNLMDHEKYMKNVPEKYRISYYDFILPHSMPLSLLVRTGVIGLGLFCFLLLSLFRMAIAMTFFGKDRFIKDWGRCLLAAFTMFLISGLFEPVFIHSLDTIFYTICALITILWQINEKQKAQVCKP